MKKLFPLVAILFVGCIKTAEVKVPNECPVSKSMDCSGINMAGSRVNGALSKDLQKCEKELRYWKKEITLANDEINELVHGK